MTRPVWDRPHNLLERAPAPGGGFGDGSSINSGAPPGQSPVSVGSGRERPKSGLPLAVVNGSARLLGPPFPRFSQQHTKAACWRTFSHICRQSSIGDQINQCGKNAIESDHRKRRRRRLRGFFLSQTGMRLSRMRETSQITPRMVSIPTPVPVICRKIGTVSVASAVNSGTPL